jgi:acetolactate synthase I/II/III large subunit
MKSTGASLVVDTLKKQGVECLFSVSGEAILSIYDACLDAGIKIYHTRSESAAVTMADGYARASGKPGVCAVTLGAGAANCVAGVVNAWLDGSPVILIAGGAPTSNWNRGDFAEIDATTYLNPITKWCKTAFDASRLPEYVQQAFSHALSGVPGPVCLQIPSNVLGEAITSPSSAIQSTLQPGWHCQADPQAVSQAAELMSNSQRPMLIAGSGVRWTHATVNLTRLIDRMAIPAFACHLGRGFLSVNHPCDFGAAMTAINPKARYAAAHCDLIIVVGARFDFELDFGNPGVFNPSAKVIQINSEMTEIGFNRMVNIGLAGDPSLILEQILNCDPRPVELSSEWNIAIRQAGDAMHLEWELSTGSDLIPIHPARLCKEITDFLRPEAIVTLGGGNIYSWGRTLIEPHSGGQLLAPYTTWSLGCAIPLALGAKVAIPDRQVLALSGDGSVGYDMMEMDTAARYNLPIVCVIANDGGWSMMADAQRQMYGPKRVYATELVPRAYDQIAQVLGCYGESVSEPGQIASALRRAYSSQRPACLNIRTAAAYAPDMTATYGEPKEIG